MSPATSAVHIFRADWQPLTRYRDVDGRLRSNPARRVFRCRECRDWRTASKLKIQVYYDYSRIQCADGCYGTGRKPAPKEG
jgi:hypothetical protein